MFLPRTAILPALLALISCGGPSGPAKPTAEDAKKFLAEAESKLLSTSTDSGRASWIHATYINVDTEALSALESQRQIDLTVKYAKEAAQYDGVQLPPEMARKMSLLKNALTLATPSDPKEAEEVTRLQAGLEGHYGKAKYCPQGGECLDVTKIERVMAESRDEAKLREVWAGWHDTARSTKRDYARFVELSNKGARELGFADTGAMWRSKYDMPPDAFAKELDRLWDQVKPLYQSLHAYARKRLRARYGNVVPEKGPIPAHLFGNIWAQSWENIYPLLAVPNADLGYDLTNILRARKVDSRGMVKYGEGFFTSLGFAPLPQTFWERSQFDKPRDREVVCHASAWDVDNVDDLRIKMCIQITAEDFNVIHHELGHNFYQRAYNQQPFLFRDAANDGFHEAIGDAIALSITPDYLKKLNFITTTPDPSKDLGLLMDRALAKVAFLPFGLLVDQWRWKVFNGEVKPDNYNSAWWDLRLKYEGIVPPTPRGEEYFDPGAKYHVPADVPYSRYFIAHVVQFQFHRAMARAAGCTEPLHRCSVYDSKPAGDKLKAMLEMGQSKPWPEALKALTGEDRMDATAMMDYFAPLKKWLDDQNAGAQVGW